MTDIRSCLGALALELTPGTRESVSDLPAWIIKGFITLGFTLLALQSLAEAIRRIDFLRGGSSTANKRSMFERPNVI